MEKYIKQGEQVLTKSNQAQAQSLKNNIFERIYNLADWTMYKRKAFSQADEENFTNLIEELDQSLKLFEMSSVNRYAFFLNPSNVFFIGGSSRYFDFCLYF